MPLLLPWALNPSDIGVHIAISPLHSTKGYDFAWSEFRPAVEKEPHLSI
jgi:hypothetical protein